MEKLKYKKGESILVSRGEYADYEIEVLVKVKIDFNANEEFKLWAKDNLPLCNGVIRKDGYINFTDWLIKKVIIEEVKHREMHIGSYGKYKLSEC